jgi:hypothetical protein
MNTPRFPIGLTFSRKRYAKAKELTDYIILDIYTTRNNAGEVVDLQYLVSHSFMGQGSLTELMCDTTIARSLTNEQLKGYVK